MRWIEVSSSFRMSLEPKSQRLMRNDEQYFIMLSGFRDQVLQAEEIVNSEVVFVRKAAFGLPSKTIQSTIFEANMEVLMSKVKELHLKSTNQD